LSREISVIIAVYNRARYLRYCLESLARQTYKNFEVIVADDGSSSEIKEVVRDFRGAFPIKHVWQEDAGFRKCLILNKAVKISNGEKLFFFDGDVIVHPKYLETSRECVRRGQYIVSRSTYLSELLTKIILRKKMTVRNIFGPLFFPFILYDWLFGKTRFFEYGIFLPEFLFLSARRFKKDKHIFGRCWAVARSDYEDVNGYNNEFIGAYHEDFELTSRLKFAGLKPVLFINRAVTYHLHHKKVPENRDNKILQFKTEKMKKKTCENGLAQIKKNDVTELD